MPITTRTATHDHHYMPLRPITGFRLELKVEYTVDTDDPCRILGVRKLDFKVYHRAPGWNVVDRDCDHTMNVVASPDCTSSSGKTGARDQLYVHGDVIMALKTPGIPTPWGSIGSVTLDEVQITMHLWITADGAVTKDVTVND